jgi:hypothetical protein
MAYTDPITVSIGDVGHAADWNTYIRDNFRALLRYGKVKASDTSRASNTTTSADPDLTFPIAASEIFVVKFFLRVSFNSTGRMKLHVHAPSGATGSWGFWFVGTANTVFPSDGSVGTLGTDQSTGAAVGTGTYSPMEVQAHVINSTTAGNVEFWWAQATSDVGATIVRAGSFEIADRI